MKTKRFWKNLLMMALAIILCALPLTVLLKSKGVMKPLKPTPNPDNLLAVGNVSTFPSVSKNGVTFMQNEDGSWHIYGTSTEAFGVYLTTEFNLEAGKTYMFSNGAKMVGVKSCYMAVFDGTYRYVGDLSPDSGSDPVVSGAFTCKSDSTKYVLLFRFPYAGTTVDETFYPVLVEGTEPGDFYISAK